MWLYMIAIALVLVGIVGGILTGGIFTIVFIPLGVIMLIVAAATGGLARLKSSHHPGPEPDAPLPHTTGGTAGAVATSPEGLADARRSQQ